LNRGKKFEKKTRRWPWFGLDVAKWMDKQSLGGAVFDGVSIRAVGAALCDGCKGAAKRAVLVWTPPIAIEWGRNGIQTNTMTPGATDAALAEATKAVSKLRKCQPVRSVAP
jgi:NAD(P)-dependent dehydrogenase (short-subunit alcohol dehydrogenase family)